MSDIELLHDEVFKLLEQRSQLIDEYLDVRTMMEKLEFAIKEFKKENEILRASIKKQERMQKRIKEFCIAVCSCNSQRDSSGCKCSMCDVVDILDEL